MIRLLWGERVPRIPSLPLAKARWGREGGLGRRMAGTPFLASLRKRLGPPRRRRPKGGRRPCPLGDLQSEGFPFPPTRANSVDLALSGRRPPGHPAVGAKAVAGDDGKFRGRRAAGPVPCLLPEAILRAAGDILTDSPLDAGAGPLPVLSGRQGFSQPRTARMACPLPCGAAAPRVRWLQTFFDCGQQSHKEWYDIPSGKA